MRNRSPRWLILLSAALTLMLAVGFLRAQRTSSDVAEADPALRPGFASNDPIERGCALPAELLLRTWRGVKLEHSERISMVPWAPNYFGTFSYMNHSGPWDYLQRVPLVVYGGDNIKNAAVERPVTIADVFPTVGELTGVKLPKREGRALEEAIVPGAAPKLVVVVVWDGVGSNVLARWRGRTPALDRLIDSGTSYSDAIVGSSPSITPATHSNLGTGSWPRKHGVTGIKYRTDSGVVRTSFAGNRPDDLRLTTFADEIDLALRNRPRVGMLGWRGWHLGMLGHGSATPGGDADELAIIGADASIGGNDDFYVTPSYLPGAASFDEHAIAADRGDGEADGTWRGHDIDLSQDNPAWITYQSDLLLEMLRRGRYGADRVPDLFFTNFKMADIVGHRYNMDSEEMGLVLEAEDRALERLVDYLDRSVGDYTLILTADHGHTPPPERSGAWPIDQGELEKDVDEHFAVPPDRSLFEATTSTGPFVDPAVMNDLGITYKEIATFLNRYTIRDNEPGVELPAGYEARGDEPVFAAAFPTEDLDAVMECAFGSTVPPGSVDAQE